MHDQLIPVDRPLAPQLLGILPSVRFWLSATTSLIGAAVFVGSLFPFIVLAAIALPATGLVPFLTLGFILWLGFCERILRNHAFNRKSRELEAGRRNQAPSKQ